MTPTRHASKWKETTVRCLTTLLKAPPTPSSNNVGCLSASFIIALPYLYILSVSRHVHSWCLHLSCLDARSKLYTILHLFSRRCMKQQRWHIPFAKFAGVAHAPTDTYTL